MSPNDLPRVWQWEERPGSELQVDKSSAVPAYLQLKEQLEQAIYSGALAPGSALPSERGLADSLGLSRMTVRRAFETLVAAGLVEQRRGSGTFVRAQPLEQPVERLKGFSEEAVQAGLVPGSELITVEQLPATEVIAAALNLKPGAPVLRLLRVRTANGDPLELQDAYLPTRFLALSIVELTEGGSLYRGLDAQFGVRPLRGRQSLGARLPTADECRHLRLARDTPVLAIERITYGLDERPFEYVLSAMRGDRYRMVLQVRE